MIKTIYKLSFMFLILMLPVLTVVAYAINIRPWLGLATVGLDSVNEELEILGEELESAGYNENTSLTKFGIGYSAGVEIGVFRIGYIAPSPAKFHGETTILGSTMIVENLIEANLATLSIGYRLPLKSGKTSFVAGIYLGYGEALVNNIQVIGMGSTEIKIQTSYKGSNPIGELVLVTEFGGKSDTNFVLTVSYRYAPIEKVLSTQELDLNNDGIVDILEVSEGGPLAFDFSGLAVNLGIRFHIKSKPKPEEEEEEKREPSRRKRKRRRRPYKRIYYYDYEPYDD